ncbi:antibiotic biosynthesis monooxygenase [Nocardiopsis sp. RSe5-2]|uniref:Antibiotic biosynthesis monooxygenase n=1 Tax=Nocardiopsis endophytica TaxID=3018445 RepID=A0ABT4U7P2_9ACTN|nr:antibiotic biosynthesis monooxygenase family protein [Nocardiopsis endophytica]MDA2812978.1 antibiotic biosynthesis monooxygenase [Nocardiopsis endophytica]
MGPVRAVLTMTVAEEDTGPFEKEWARVAAWVRDEPGCRRQTLVRTSDPVPTYVITSDWDDAEAYRSFETSSRQDRETARLRALRTGAHMQVMSIVDHWEKP